MKKSLSLVILSLLLSACTASVSVQPNLPTPNASPSTPAQSPAPTTPPTGGSPSPTGPSVPSTPLHHLNFDPSLTDLGNQGYEARNITKTTDRFGRADQALAFSGDGSSLKANIDINPSKMPQLTMGIWARHTGSMDSNGIFQVVSHDNAGFDRSLGIDYRAGNFGWSAFSGETAEGDGVVGAGTITAGQWVFLTVVYDAPAQTTDLYVNGTRIASKNGVQGEGVDYLLFGANPAFVEHFQGDMDDFYLYNRKLSESEIQQLYLATQARPQ